MPTLHWSSRLDLFDFDGLERGTVKLFAGIILLSSLVSAYACADSASSAPPLPPQESFAEMDNDLEICLMSSLSGVDLGRLYFVFNISKEDITAEFDPTDHEIVKQFFSGVESGNVKNPYQFAQAMLFSCMKEHHIPVVAKLSDNAVQNCFYKSDVVYFAYSARHRGLSKEKAKEEIEATMTDKKIVATDFVMGVIDLIYATPDDIRKVNGGRRGFVRSCIVRSVND